jgi:hypothetical protein
MTKELDAAFGLVTFVMASVIAYVALTRGTTDASTQLTAAQRAEAAS